MGRSPWTAIGVKIREAAKTGGPLGLGRHWSAHVDERYCVGGRDSFRYGLPATDHRPEPPRGGPRVSCGSGTMRYAWADSACNSRNWYPQGESGPDGCTRRCARAAAIKARWVMLLEPGIITVALMLERGAMACIYIHHKVTKTQRKNNLNNYSGY